MVRFSDGYSNRANSVNPIYHSTENVQNKIDTCEKLFKSKNLRPTFKITPSVHPENLVYTASLNDPMITAKAWHNIEDAFKPNSPSFLHGFVFK